MDRVRLLPMQLPSASSINGNGSSTGNGAGGAAGNGKGRGSFVRRLALGFVILAGLGLLYVPAYHSAQGQYSGLGETPSPAGSLGGTHFVASVAQLRGWGYNTSRDVGSYIHPDNATAILSPRSVCSENGPPYLLVVVCSAVANQNARLAIRSTWGNKSNLDTLYNSTVRIVFLLGQSDNDTLNSYVVDENHLYNDIIQESFHDSYNNLTLKSIMLLKWVTANCDKVTYLMKSDDDMFVNVPALLKSLKGRSKSTGALIGSLICNARPILDPKNKWYTPKYMYAERTYPNYLSGTAYVMSYDVAVRLYKAAFSTPLLHLEDVYITGMCAKRAGIKPANHNGFSYVPRKLEVCSLRDAITAHKVNATFMHTIWSKLSEPGAGGACIPLTHGPVPVTDGKKTPTSGSRVGRHIGYFLLKSRTVNSRCV